MKKIKPFYRVFIIICLLFIVSLGISILFPMFFRMDDARNIEWSVHHNLIDLFNVQVTSSWGMYRPFANLIFIVFYRLFGINPFGYQVICTTVFLLDFYLLYYLCKKYFNIRTGIVAILIYCLLFYNNFQMAFWFSDIVFTMHIMFTFLSIIFYLKSKENIKFIFISYLFAFMGAFTKEPAILIITVFVFADFLIQTRKEDYLKKIWIIIPYMGFGLLLLIISPVIKTRLEYSSSTSTLLSDLDYRYRYYFDFLLHGSKKIIPLLISILFAVSLQKSIWVKLMLIILSIPCYFNTYYFIVFLFAISFFFFIQQKKLLPFLLWMLATSLTLPFVGYITPSYLFEFSFGFSIFLGYVINKHLIESFFLPVYAKNRKASYIILSLFSLLCLGVALKPIGHQVKALQLVVETRKNLAEGFVYLEKNKAQIKTVVVPDQDSFDSYETKAQKGIMSNADKVKSMKTMAWIDVKAYLSLLKCTNVKVIPFSEFLMSSTIDKSVVLLLQNDVDIQFAKEKNLIGSILFSYSHFKTNNLIICSFK